MLQEPFARYRESMRNEAVAPYRSALLKRRGSLFFKRLADIIVSLICILILLPFYLIAAVAVKLSSKGPVFYLQTRVGREGGAFSIIKFRTMAVNADKKGEITVGSSDPRITKVGAFLRKTNFDEFPQFFNVFKGDMSIIGVRPEVPHYVDYYTQEQFATLLMRPGMTSPASIKFRHENDILKKSSDPEKTYIEEVLQEKMRYNLEYIREFSFINDLKILGKTFKCVFEKDEALK